LSECGITDPLQIYSGWLDEHEHDHGMQFWPPNVLTDITQFLLAHGDVALTNDMLKDQKGSISCCPLKHHLVMAPKASSTCMPKNTRSLAPPSFDLSSSRTLRFSTFQHQECRVDHQAVLVQSPIGVKSGW
jgi:hypothetical protein